MHQRAPKGPNDGLYRRLGPTTTYHHLPPTPAPTRRTRGLGRSRRRQGQGQGLEAQRCLEPRYIFFSSFLTLLTLFTNRLCVRPPPLPCTATLSRTTATTTVTDAATIRRRMDPPLNRGFFISILSLLFYVSRWWVRRPPPSIGVYFLKLFNFILIY